MVGGISGETTPLPHLPPTTHPPPPSPYHLPPEEDPLSSTFMQSPRLFFTSESVTEGHPDKLCDQISDAILDAIFAKDPNARVACETATTTGLIMVFGEITTDTYVEMQDIVRDTVQSIGYTRAKYG